MTVLLPGSYDPPTVGHLAVIERAAALYDRVIVAVFINPSKTGLFTHRERVAFLKLATTHLSNVTVDFSDGYVADYAKDHGVGLIIKGTRNETDRLYEEEMAAYNKQRGGVDTLLLPSDPDLAAVSSTAVREALEAGLPTEDLLPKGCYAAVHRAYAAKK